MGFYFSTLAHHPEKYATKNLAQAQAHLQNGSPFEDTYLPSDHKWKDWTMKEEISKQKSVIIAIDELNKNGDWGMN
ncbi:hypothetical protein GGR53DRAFT_462620 [Hypoxylon sp. FL1150]|nr:hypothetical protein GGR53DRAFT_462620 [Hypoxylon sp. FL1150]